MNSATPLNVFFMFSAIMKIFGEGNDVNRHSKGQNHLLLLDICIEMTTLTNMFQMTKRGAMSPWLNKKHCRSNFIWIWQPNKCNDKASKNAHSAAWKQSNNRLIGHCLHGVYAIPFPKKGLAIKIITSSIAENSWQICLNCQSKGPQCKCREIYKKNTLYKAGLMMTFPYLLQQDKSP